MIKIGEFVFNEQEGLITTSETSVPIRPQTALLLIYLIENQDRVLSKEELFEHVWKGRIVAENTLVQSITELRKVFSDSSRDPEYIKTYSLRGYRWIFESVILLSSKKDPVENNNGKNSVFSGIDLPSISFWNSLHSALKYFLVILLSGLAFAIYHLYPVNQPSQDATQISILPVVNDTGDPQYDWIEQGLMDMIVSGLNQQPGILTTSSLTLQHYLSQDNLSYRQLRNNELKKLLVQTNSRYLLKSYVRKDGDGLFRFHYSLISNIGQTNERIARFKNLAAAVPQIIELLRDEMGQTNLLEEPQFVSYSLSIPANENYAQGIYHLTKKGAPIARLQFEAALKHDPDFLWAKLRLAQSTFDLGDWTKTEQLYQQISESSTNDSLLKLLTLKGKARLEVARGRDDLGLKTIKQALKLLELENRLNLKISFLTSLEAIKYRLGDFDGQKKLEQELEVLIEKQTLANGNRSNVDVSAQTTNNLTEVVERLSQKLLFFQQQGNLKAEAVTHKSLGLSMSLPVKNREEHFNHALMLFESLDNPLGFAKTQSAKAYFHIQQYEYSIAIELLTKSLVTHRKLGSINGQAWDNFYLGIATLQLVMSSKKELDDESLDRVSLHFNKAFSYFKKMNQRQNIAQTQLFLGVIASQSGEFQLARNHLSTARAQFIDMKMPLGVAMSDITLGAMFMQNKKWSKASQHLAKVPSFLVNGWFIISLYKARCFYQLGEYATAVKLAQQAKTSAKDNWDVMDDFRLETYQNMLAGKSFVELPDERNAFKEFWKVQARLTQTN